MIIRTFDQTSHTWSPDATGFLSYPDGTFTPANTGGVRYDAKRKRWLPQGIPTPDGAGYIYTTETAVHRVWLDTGADQTIVSGKWWAALGFVADQLYLAEVVPAPVMESGAYTMRGLARTSASGGDPVFITHQGSISALSSMGGWELDRADGMMQAPDRVLHLDLNTGAIEPWLTGMPGVMFSGFDAQGHPFVFNHGDTLRVVQLMAKDSPREVFVGPYAAPWPEPPYFVDGKRVWFSGFSITDPKFDAPALLYEPGVGLHPSVGVPGAQVTVAGPCTNE